MNIIYVRVARARGYIRVGIEDGETAYDLTVSEMEYAEAGFPSVNSEPTRDAFDILRIADMRFKAKKKTLAVLSYGDNSERMLMRKLTAAGIRRDIAEEAVLEAVKCGYINAQRQLERLIKNEVASNLSGPRKIIPKLISKGYGRADIERVISELTERGEIDFDEAKRLLAERRLPQDASDEDVKKLLYKNGYSVC